MRRGAELLGLAAAGVVATAVVLGGAFDPGERLLIGGLAALLAVWLVVVSDDRLEPEEWCALGVIAWGFVGTATHAGYPLAAKEMLGGWLVAWVVWSAANRAGEAPGERIARVVSVAAAAVGAGVLLECLESQQPRMGGLFVNPNVAAAMLVPAVPLIWSFRHRLRPVWTGTALAVVIGGAVATGSRAGLVALVVVVGLMLPRGAVRRVGVAAMAVIAVGLVVWRFAIRPDTLAWHRLEIWRALWSLVVDNPLWGVGAGWLEEATGVVRIPHVERIARFGHVIGGAESTIYGLVVRTGFVGIGLAAASAVLALRGARRSGALGSSAVQALVAGILVLAAFHDVLDVDVVLWWWALLLGVGVARGGDEEASPEMRIRPTWARSLAALAVGGLILWSVARPAYAQWLWWGQPSSVELADRVARAEPWSSEPSEWRTRDLLRRERWTWEEAAEAVACSRESVAVHPGSARLWSLYGRIHGRVAQELGIWDDAVEEARVGFRRAGELEPWLPWYLLEWAQFERALGEHERALELCVGSLSREPNFVRGRLLRARLYLDLGRRDLAAEAFRRAENAARLGSGRSLKGYERDLLFAPRSQVNELRRLLGTAEAGPSG
jgi:hypothetical protein